MYRYISLSESCSQLTPTRLTSSNNETAQEGSSAKGVGVVGGRTQAWIDQVGALGMARIDARLAARSRATIDTLRAMDHTIVHSNTDLIVALVRHIIAQCVGRCLVFAFCVCVLLLLLSALFLSGSHMHCICFHFVVFRSHTGRVRTEGMQF